MPNALPEFFVQATQEAAENLETALKRLPEDKRSWSPMGQARTALDQVAECAILNGGTADLLQSRAWPDGDFSEFERARAELAKDEAAALALLRQNTERVIAVLRAVPEADLGVEVAMPWRPMTMAQIIAYPYWNMSYHEAQINYIASMLGCLS